MKKLMKSVLACLLAFAMVLTVMPVNSYAAAKKSVVVTNQKQLEKALKNGATNIVIKTNKNVKITIPATKKAAKASISVQAKNATITNKASVKSIVIKDAKAFVESGKNNDIKITDSKLSLTVAKGSKGADIKVAKKDAEIKVVAKGNVASVTVAKTADVTLTVNKTATVASVNVAAKGATVDLNAKGTVSDVKVSEKAADTKLNINASGKVENVQIDAKADVAVAGSTTEAVKVTVNAKDTTIKAETAVETTLNADAKVDLSKGAEGSRVTTAENVKVDVTNNTTDKVTVKDSTGKESTVDAGKTETKTDEGKKNDNSNSGATNTNPGNISWGGSENDIGLDGVSGDGPDKTVEVGDEITLVPIFIPANATNKSVEWSISDASVASLDDNGVVHGKKPGTTKVTVTTDQMGYKYTWNIEVTEAALKGLEITQSYATVYVGDTCYYAAEAVPSAAKLDNVKWVSTNENVATIDSATGKFTAKSVGVTSIYAECRGIRSSEKVLEVCTPPENAVKVTFYDGDNILCESYVEKGSTLKQVIEWSVYEPEKEGYEFKGWKESRDTSDLIDENTEINQDYTVYAHYEICTYRINFGEQEYSGEYGTEVKAPSFEPDQGEVFLGWATSANATTPEIKAGASVTYTEDVFYYPVLKTKMILYTQTGEHVKFYTGALKDKDGNNLEYNSDGTIKGENANGYLPYAEHEIALRFEAEAGYMITEITLDGVTHKISDEKPEGKGFVEQAVKQGYAAVKRDRDHSLDIKAVKMNLSISPASEKVTKSSFENGDHKQFDLYTITGSAVSLKEVVKVDSPQLGDALTINYTYTPGNEGNWRPLSAEEKVFTPSVYYWFVNISVEYCGKTIQQTFCINVKSPDTTNNEGSSGTVESGSAQEQI